MDSDFHITLLANESFSARPKNYEANVNFAIFSAESDAHPQQPLRNYSEPN